MGARIVPLAAAFVAAFFCGALMDCSLWAQEPAVAGPAGNLLAQVKWLRLEVVGGRVVVKSERCPHSQHVVEATPGEGMRQVLALESRARILTLRYEEQTPESRVAFVLDERGRVTISRWAPDSAVREVQYVQPAAGAVTLSIAGKTTQKITATDLWQLLIAERQRCSECLLPVFQQLRSDWALDEQLDGIEAQLMAHRASDAMEKRA